MLLTYRIGKRDRRGNMEKKKADQIIIEYLPKIYGFAVRKTFFYEEADELCSDMTEAVYLSLLKKDEIDNIGGYVRRICERVYAQYVAAKKKSTGISIDDVILPAEEVFPEDDTEEKLLRLRREITFLSRKRRDIVYSFYYQDKPIATIAAEQSLPEGTVKWHLNQARSDLKKGIGMERKIGKLGMKPIEAQDIAHSGTPGSLGGPEYYLEDKLNLNIVYSVYFTPLTKEEIAQEVGVVLPYLEDRIDFLEKNGFLVRQSGNRFTTFVKFSPCTYSLENNEKHIRKKLEVAKVLVREYVPLVRTAVEKVSEVYIPGGNRELLEAAAIFYGVSNKCRLKLKKDLSRYEIKTTDGGSYVASVDLPKRQSDPEYRGGTLSLPDYWACGNMTRWSEKYPAVNSWAIDSRLSVRKGGWQNNLTSDYEYLYEVMAGMIVDNSANSDKFRRLRERGFLTSDGQVNIMVVKGSSKDFFAGIPLLDEQVKECFARDALDAGMAAARDYPPQMQDLVMNWTVEGFIGRECALMVMDLLYGNGTFRELTPREKITSNLILFSDILPTD